MKPKDIEWICWPCGHKYGTTHDSISTCHINTCSVCKEKGVPVTGARHYRPYDVEKLKEVK